MSSVHSSSGGERRARSLKPPRLTVGPLSGKVFVVTVGRINGRHKGRELIEAITKYDVTDQFDAIVEQRVREATDRELDRRAKS